MKTINKRLVLTIIMVVLLALASFEAGAAVERVRLTRTTVAEKLLNLAKVAEKDGLTTESQIVWKAFKAIVNLPEDNSTKKIYTTDDLKVIHD